MSMILTPDTPETRKTFNNLAREAMLTKLMQDIQFDLTVCKIEGWTDDYSKEQIIKIRDLMNHFLKED